MRENHTDNPIDARCKEQGISRRELCRRSGISYRTVESWCSGYRKSPDVYQLWRVARALGCQIEDLLDIEQITDHGDEATPQK
jgi:transcriptional regulator with XRE-family HTH domain